MLQGRHSYSIRWKIGGFFMRYTTYYEENETVRKDKYEQMKQAALTGQPKKKLKNTA